MDQCLLRQLEKRIDGLMSELADIGHGILLLDDGIVDSMATTVAESTSQGC